MKISDRKKKILQIVVDEYINTAVPVSSKTITEKHLGGEELMEKGSLSQADLDYISSVIGKKSNDLEYILKNVTKVISDLTDYTSVAITPHAEAERIRNIALLYCGDKKALLVIVTGERILRDSFVDIPEDMTAEDLEGVSKTLCKVFSGRSLRGERGRGGSLIGIFAV